MVSKLKFGLMTKELEKTTAVILQDELKQIGIDVKLSDS